MSVHCLPCGDLPSDLAATVVETPFKLRESDEKIPFVSFLLMKPVTKTKFV